VPRYLEIGILITHSDAPCFPSCLSTKDSKKIREKIPTYSSSCPQIENAINFRHINRGKEALIADCLDHHDMREVQTVLFNLRKKGNKPTTRQYGPFFVYQLSPTSSFGSG